MTKSDYYQFGMTLLDHYVFLIALALAGLAVLIYLGRHKIRQIWLNMRTRHSLNHLGLESVANVQFPDGLGQYFSVDRLVMHHDGISLLIFKRYSGRIFCADDIDEWTQVVGGKSYRFKNPLVDLDYQIRAVSSRAPDVTVNGFLFFDHRAQFPKGHPERVIQIETMPVCLKRDKLNKVQAPVEKAWRQLLTSSGSK
jgi:hypothetical protein